MAGNPARVLVIEDDDDVARVVGMCLVEAGFEVQRVNTGEAALELMQLESQDAVVLDLGLPDRLGGEVLCWLRQPPGGNGPPWVVISALEKEEAGRRHGSLGHFLAKPFDPWALVRILEDLIEEGRQRPLG